MTPVLALSSETIVAIVVIVVIDLFAIFFGLSFVRTRRAQQRAEAATTAALLGEPAPPAPKPVSRRQFFRRSLVVSLLVFGAQFGGATLAFLWPRIRGFGGVINAGKLEDILAYINENDQPYYSGTGRFYIVKYNGRADEDVDYAAEGVTAEGIMPLYQRCVHLGCRVPFCQQSQWFECPCHGSKYNTAGEYKLGPAPRGLDRFRVSVEGGDVLVDTAEIILGPPRGADTLNRPQAGPFCVAVQ